MGPEARIQRKVIDYGVKTYNLLHKKMETGRYATTGWPDVLFLGIARQTQECEFTLMEFKAPGGRLTPLQAERHRQLEKRKAKVYVVNSVDDGRTILDEVYG